MIKYKHAKTRALAHLPPVFADDAENVEGVERGELKSVAEMLHHLVKRVENSRTSARQKYFSPVVCKLLWQSTITLRFGVCARSEIGLRW